MSERLVISEYYIMDIDPKILKEATEDPTKPMLLQDKLLQKANTKNANGRVYPKRVLNRETNKYAEKVKLRMAMGELDHPDSPVVELKNVSHLITNIYMEGEEVRGDLEILNTPPGQILKSLIQQGVKIGVSSRGIGSLQNEGGQNIVQDDFELIAFDAVSSPSTPGAFLVESTQANIDKYNNLRNIVHNIMGDSYFK